MFFDSWSQLLRVVVSAFVAYIALVGLLRVSGTRTLAKLNAFDFVVTIALGSTLATIALSSDVTITEGTAAFATLVAFQLLIAWFSSRVSFIRASVKSDPVIIMLGGEMLTDVIRRERLSVAEVRQAIRSAGIGDVELVAAVVIETDGTLSVISCDQIGSGSAPKDAIGHHDWGTRPRTV